MKKFFKIKHLSSEAMPRLVRRFERVDADRDGQISKEELAAARKAHFEQRGERRPRSERPAI